MLGGKRPGAGRKPMSFSKRRVPFTISLPPAYVDMLDNLPDSRSYTVENALRKVFGADLQKGVATIMEGKP